MTFRRIVGTVGSAVAALLVCGAAVAGAASQALPLATAQGTRMATSQTSATAGVAPVYGNSYAFTPTLAYASLVQASAPAKALAPSAVVPQPAQPVNSGAAPSITPHNATVGAVLTADPGVWTGTGTVTNDYQWQTCNASSVCTNVGADQTTYTVAQSDIGNTIVVAVTGTDSTGTSAPVTSAPTAVVPGPPTNNGAPSITPHSPTVGARLTANTGSWTNSPTSYDYQWESCNASSVCTLVGADQNTYVVAQSDVGNTIIVAVTATNSAGTSSPASSGPTAPVPGPPANGVPSISGSATVGSTLTANHGNWTNSPTTYDYQWESCNASSVCTPVGADQNTYVVAQSDVGNTIIVAVTATNSAGTSSPASSGPTAPVPGPPVNNGLPSISGNAAVGQTLTANHGSWTNSPTSYSYQWQSCNASSVCSNVGTNSNTYVVAQTDVGNTIIVAVTATNSAGTSSPATSGPTAPVPGPPVINGALPSISGNAAVGQTLTANHGNWTNNPTSYSYQWESCNASSICSNVGTNSSTYVVAQSDVGNTIIVAVTATNSAGTSSPDTSGPTAVVVGAPANTVLPGITGVPVVGQTLSATQGTWTNSPTSFAYLWQSCNAQGTSCTNTSDTTSTYPVGSGDAGKTLRVQVTASNLAGPTAATSAVSAVVVVLPANTAAPTVGGTAAVGQTLNATTGTWTGSAPITYSYQWQRCNAAGASCVNTGSTGSAYTVGTIDIGATLRVVVTASNPATTLTATPVSANSAATSPPVARPPGLPIAAFTHSILTMVPETGSPVTFTSTSTPFGGTSITQLSWNFGDGSPSVSGASVTHTFSAAGTYTVVLTVTQSDGQQAQTPAVLTVDAPPTSGFTWSPASPSAGTGVTFQNTAVAGTGGIGSYSWSFGDGGTSNAANPTHTFVSPGNYTVTLTVMQFDGLTATVQHSIAVTAQPVITPNQTPGNGAAALKRWLAHLLSSSGSAKIGALLKKNGEVSAVSARNAAGHVTITWYATVRKHRIVVARGSAALQAGASAHMTIKLTGAGRALLAKVKQEKITMSGTFSSGKTKVTAAKTLIVKR